MSANMGAMSVHGGDATEGASAPSVVPFGKYLLLERLAVGGMAEVFLAKSFGIEGFERILAVKRIAPSMAEDQSFIEMFIDEAKIAGHLSHANIASIYELGKVGNAHYIAMEYVWGKDLLQIMNRHRLFGMRMPGPRVAYIAARTCEALDYAHNKRDARGKPLELIHRDISPQNVLVSYDGQVKLIDFGIAKAQSRTTKTVAGFVKGKFGYMSPEQVRGKKIDARSDLFAVGICMYEMLTCERLFAGETDFETMDMIRQGKVRPLAEVLPTVPLELEAIVMKALAKEPEDRYQTASEMHQALMRWLMSQKPPFTSARLAEWMQSAFEDEMTEEKAKIDAYRKVGQDALAGRTSSPPGSLGLRSGEFRAPSSPGAAVPETDDDETLVQKTPEFTSLDLEDWSDQPTQVFFSESDRDQAAASPAAEGVRFEPDAADEIPTSPGTQPSPNGLPAPTTPARRDPTPARVWPSEQPEEWAKSTRERTGPQKLAPPEPKAPIPPSTTAKVRAVLETPKGKAGAAAIVVALAGLGYAMMRGPSTGSLHVSTGPAASAAVSIDGQPRGSAPMHLEGVAPGTHVVEVAAPGYRSVRQEVIVEAGGSATVHVELAAEPR
ncbi:MAG: protein kinase [Polyangiales bacterium]